MKFLLQIIMSKIVSDCFQICRSPINYSHSKQLYSFSRYPRFKKLGPGYCDSQFYSPSLALSQRATTLGKGNRYSFTRQSVGPAPGAYELPSDFSRKLRRGYKFGIGRGFYSKVFVKNAQNTGSNPGPGTYTLPASPTTPQYTMRARTSNSFLHPIFKGECAILFN